MNGFGRGGALPRLARLGGPPPGATPLGRWLLARAAWGLGAMWRRLLLRGAAFAPSSAFAFSSVSITTKPRKA